MIDNQCIIFAIEGNRLFMYIRRVSDHACSRLNDYSSNPGIPQSLRVIPELVRRHSQVHPKYCPALRHVPKLITITPMVLMNQSSGFQVTPKAGWNALLGSVTLLKLMLLSIPSISSQILPEVPRDQNTFC